MTKTCLNVTLEDVGKAFAKHGYVKKSNNEYMQYNEGINSFSDVPIEKVMDIFTNVYPNFERIKLTLDLLDDFIPSFSSGDVQTYELCKLLKTNGKDNVLKKSNSNIIHVFKENEKKKKDVSSFIFSEYDKMIQHLINNDIFTDRLFLYNFKNNTFKFISKEDEVKTVSQILDAYYTKIDNKEIDYTTVIDKAKRELTNIQSIKKDIEFKYDVENISNKQWETYNKINNLISSYGGIQDGI